MHRQEKYVVWYTVSAETIVRTAPLGSGGELHVIYWHKVEQGEVTHVLPIAWLGFPTKVDSVFWGECIAN
jgi:hypothetical protein